jgi:ParB family transcriptional regulator, chromosome partitioning protein
MMGKLEEMRRSASLGARPAAFPPGMDPAQAVGRPAHLDGVRGDRSSAWIAVDRIERDPDQPREEFDEETLGRLAESLRTRGQLQPIRVRWDAGRGVYVILAGERRWRAARMAGLAELQCVIHDAALEAEERLALQLVENALREDLRPVEQARAYKRLLEAQRWTMTELASELGVHQTSVSRALALLELPCTVQEQVEQGALAPSAAAEIAKLPDPEQQHAVAQEAIASGLKRSEVAAVVQAVKAKRPAPAKSPEPVTIDLGDGMTVTIRWRKATGVTAAQVLKKALKMVQDRDRDDEAA